MPPIIATDSCASQQLISACELDNLQPMVVNQKQDFADRLNKACSDAPDPIVIGRGRREELRRRLSKIGLNVSGESVRKWLSGESIPSMDNLRFIATVLNVLSDWLLTGRLPVCQEKKPEILSVREPMVIYRKSSDEIIEKVVVLMQMMSEAEKNQVLGAAMHIDSQRIKHGFNEATGT